MLFAAVGVEVLGSETTETDLRTLLLPCYLQLLGCRCWGARRRRRICGRCCYHAICSCWGGGAGERDYRDGSADAAVTMLFAAVGVQVLGSETEETNLRTVLLPSLSLQHYLINNSCLIKVLQFKYYFCPLIKQCFLSNIFLLVV